MDESFLQYIWRCQNFDHSDIKTSDGASVRVIHPGTPNCDAGPDFFNAKIKIDQLLWTGNVEIHTEAKAWITHGHETDAAYNNVILHVVWHNKGLKTYRTDGSTIPTLELKGRVSEEVLLKYDQLVQFDDSVPCRRLLQKTEPILIDSMLDHVLARRLERKAQEVLAVLQRVHGDWEETSYRMLAANFGFKTNKEPFELLVRSLPLKLLRKHMDRKFQMEAMVFGVAGFLQGKPADSYQRTLMDEFNFLAAKYGLQDKKLDQHIWKFSRVRPANFPTLRLAQFVALVEKIPNLFSHFSGKGDHRSIINALKVKPSEYWERHYHFGLKTGRPSRGLGTDSIRNISINTMAPMLAAYGKLHDDQQKMEEALDLLSNQKPEKNRISKLWSEAGIRVDNAFRSQGLIELYNEYCTSKRCVQCKIGAFLIAH